MKPESPFKSWKYDEDLGYWVAPTAIPDVSLPYKWSETKKEWELMEFPAE
jgi:hypothetical protein